MGVVEIVPKLTGARSGLATRRSALHADLLTNCFNLSHYPPCDFSMSTQFPLAD